MLFILHKGNHPDITYHGGQEPILHLEVDLKAAIRWAENNNVRWAFSDRNAGGYLAKFYKSVDDLDKINWPAVESTVFRDMLIKEGKQAEFLTYESFPLNLIEKITFVRFMIFLLHLTISKHSMFVSASSKNRDKETADNGGNKTSFR